MKTQEQKLQHVMESADECWHECKPPDGSLCYKCGHRAVDSYLHDAAYACDDNPSPDDLNELFRLAEKLGFNHSIVSNLKRKDSKKYLVGVWNVERSYSHASNPAAALLNALFIATGGK